VCRSTRTRPLDKEQIERITAELQRLIDKHKSLAIAYAVSTIRYPRNHVIEVIRKLIEEGILTSNGIEISRSE
ncbi:MAG: hypothetical protein IKY13_05085, partial [Bacteroidaceae bacterium]|nr:hypothetical protein [Bacteroidaceae bacterium]